MTMIRSAEGARKRGFMVALERRYRRALRWTLEHRAIVVGVAAIAFLTIMVVIRPLVPFILFPQDDARLLSIKVTAPIGTPLERTEAIATNLERQILRLAVPDVSSVTARIGHQEISGQYKERGDAEHQALITVVFKDVGRDYTNAEWIQILGRELHLNGRLPHRELEVGRVQCGNQLAAIDLLALQDRQPSQRAAHLERNVHGLARLDAADELVHDVFAGCRDLKQARRARRLVLGRGRRARLARAQHQASGDQDQKG